MTPILTLVRCRHFFPRNEHCTVYRQSVIDGKIIIFSLYFTPPLFCLHHTAKRKVPPKVITINRRLLGIKKLRPTAAKRPPNIKGKQHAYKRMPFRIRCKAKRPPNPPAPNKIPPRFIESFLFIINPTFAHLLVQKKGTETLVIVRALPRIIYRPFFG